MKRVLFILLLIFSYLQYHLWQGKGSYAEKQALTQSIEQQQLDNKALQQRNAHLVAEVTDLKKGAEAIEERARMELGMIKPGEIFYQIVEQ